MASSNHVETTLSVNRYNPVYFFPGMLKAFVPVIFICVLSACESIGSASPEEHVTRAREFLYTGDRNSAIIELKNALQKDPQLTEGRWLLGSIYLQMGLAGGPERIFHGQAAEREFINARELGFADEELNVYLVRAYLLQNKYQQVLDEGSAAIEAGSSSPEVYISMGFAYLALEQLDSATSSFRAGLERDQASIDARFGLARIALNNGDIAAARELVDEMENLEPENKNVHIFRGELAFSLNDYQESEQAFRRAMELVPEDISLFFGLMRAQLGQEDFDSVSDTREMLSSQAPEHPMVKYIDAVLAMQEENLELAKSNLLEVLSVFPNHLESQLIMAKLTHDAGEFEQSRQFITSVLAQRPDAVQALNLLASVQMKSAEYVAAITTIQRLIDIQGENAQLLSMLAAVNLDAGRTDTGISLLERARELEPGNNLINSQLATVYMRQGNTEEATSILELAIENAPDSLDSRVLLVVNHLRNQDYESAIAATEEALVMEPENPSLHNLLGTAYKMSGNIDEARGYFEQALENNGSFVPSLYNMALLDAESQNLDGAISYFNQILEIEPDNFRALQGLSRIHAIRGNTDEMVRLLERSRSNNDNDAFSRLVLGRYNLINGNLDIALTMANEAAAIVPENPEIQLFLGQAQLANGMLEEAESTLTTLNSSNPGSPGVLYELAKLNITQGDETAAAEFFDDVLEILPNHLGALNARASIAIRNNDQALAQEYTERLAEVNPDSQSPKILRADILATQNRFDDAIALYQEVLDDAPSAMVVSKLSRAYEMAGNTAEAVSILNEWKADNPDDLRIDLMLAGFYLRQNETEDAINYYQNILLDDSENLIALNNLSWLYIDIDLSRAFELADKANALRPNDPGIMDTLGWILVNQGNIEQGQNLLFKALSLLPDSADIRYHYAYSLAEAGEEQKAISELSAILNDDNNFMERPAAEQLMNRLR